MKQKEAMRIAKEALAAVINGDEGCKLKAAEAYAILLAKVDPQPICLQQDDEYNEDEVCAITGWQRQTARAYRCRGAGIPFIRRGNRIFYKKADVEVFMNGKQVQTPNNTNGK